MYAYIYGQGRGNVRVGVEVRGSTPGSGRHFWCHIIFLEEWKVERKAAPRLTFDDTDYLSLCCPYSESRVVFVHNLSPIIKRSSCTGVVWKKKRIPVTKIAGRWQCSNTNLQQSHTYVYIIMYARINFCWNTGFKTDWDEGGSWGVLHFIHSNQMHTKEFLGLAERQRDVQTKPESIRAQWNPKKCVFVQLTHNILGILVNTLSK